VAVQLLDPAARSSIETASIRNMLHWGFGGYLGTSRKRRYLYMRLAVKELLVRGLLFGATQGGLMLASRRMRDSRALSGIALLAPRWHH
jgi:hypothetical protein